MLPVFDRSTPRFTASRCGLRTHEDCQERQSTEAGAKELNRIWAAILEPLARPQLVKASLGL